MMTKLLLIISEVGIVVAIAVLVAKSTLSQRKLDRLFDRIAWFLGIAVVAVLVLLACEHFAGSDFIASKLEQFLRRLHS